MKKLVIIGASGHGKVVADIALIMEYWETILFLDDNESLKTCLGLKIIGSVNDAALYKNEADFFVAIGNNKIREEIQGKLESEGFSIATLIHPSSTIGSEVSIGKGTVIMAGAVINTSTNIGSGCIINTGTIVEHDNIINNYVHLSPGVRLAGTVEVHNRSWLGVGSVVNNNLTICSDVIIGAGSVVISSITEPGVFVGVPVRRL